MVWLVLGKASPCVAAGLHSQLEASLGKGHFDAVSGCKQTSVSVFAGRRAWVSRWLEAEGLPQQADASPSCSQVGFPKMVTCQRARASSRKGAKTSRLAQPCHRRRPILSAVFCW